MASALDKLPPSLASNSKATALAKSLDQKAAALVKTRAELAQVGDRPSRVKRGMSCLAGAASAGAIAGMVDSEEAQFAITLGFGVIGAVAGAVIDSDVVFDMGVGAGSAGAHAFALSGVSAARKKATAQTGTGTNTEG